MDNEYEVLWNEFKNRILQAREVSIRQDVLIEHVVQLMKVYEDHFIVPKEEPDWHDDVQNIIDSRSQESVKDVSSEDE